MEGERKVIINSHIFEGQKVVWITLKSTWITNIQILIKTSKEPEATIEVPESIISRRIDDIVMNLVNHEVLSLSKEVTAFDQVGYRHKKSIHRLSLSENIKLNLSLVPSQIKNNLTKNKTSVLALKDHDIIGGFFDINLHNPKVLKDKFLNTYELSVGQISICLVNNEVYYLNNAAVSILEIIQAM